MKWIISSSILFGLVHPGSKIILDQGLGLTDFCLLYVGIRLIVQIPFFINSIKVNNNKIPFPWLLLLLFGLVGSALQLSEFFGLSKDLPVATVTFLVYSHPVWSLILSYFINKEKIGINDAIRVVIGIAGIYLISSQALSAGISFDLRILAPIFAGFLIALWSSLSNKLRKFGLTSFDVSFFYDLFAFIALLLYSLHEASLAQHWLQITTWIKSPTNALAICFYSIAVGLLPNFLFYLGSGSSTNLNASLLLLIEPVIATLTAFLFMNESTSQMFVIGAGLVLLSGLNIINYYELMTKQFSRFAKISFFIAIIVVVFNPDTLYAKKLYILEVSPQNQTDYTVADEMKLIDSSAELAIEKSKSIFPKCKVEVVKHLKSGTEEELFKYSESLSDKSERVAIVGLSRSTFARIGAKALKNKNILGISIGASSAKFNELNSKFFSIVSPLKSQIEEIHAESVKLNCQTMVGMFDSKDPLSADYKIKFQEIFGDKGKILEIDASTKLNRISDSCVFIGLNFAKSAKLVNQIFKMDVKQIFGTGDWSIHATELQKSIVNHTESTTHPAIHTPTGWIKSINPNSKWFASELMTKYNISSNPIGAYTYDSVLVAMESLCSEMPIKSIIAQGKVKHSLLRNYFKISESQNLLSKMNMIHFGVKP